MADGGFMKYEVTSCSPQDKLASLRHALLKANDDKFRLERAIEFLEQNPGALALINSL